VDERAKGNVQTFVPGSKRERLMSGKGKHHRTQKEDDQGPKVRKGTRLLKQAKAGGWLIVLQV
jgi:hypothetical protein